MSSENATNKQNLENCSRDELVARIQALEAHNIQLRNIIAKSRNEPKKQHSHQKFFDFDKCTFRHILLKFYYLGWNYQGYVTQEDTTNTVEHHLFEALTKTCLIKARCLSNYHRCGRTDKGVSSFGQTISISVRSVSPDDTSKELPYCKMLNRVLPDNIQCVAWCPVADNFNARFDCQGRIYKYFFPRGSLDISSMTEAANFLLGTHDFRNFCKMDVANGVVEFIRSITSVKIYSLEPGDWIDPFAIYVFHIEGKAFLWHQIRCILGVLFLVGEGKERPEIVQELLDIDKNPRKPDYNMASEIPLNLYHCQYDGIEWIYDRDGIAIALKKLRDMWTFTQIKAVMMNGMLKDMQFYASYNCMEDVSSSLIQGVKSKTYIPVMKRQLCGSLADRIEHYKKRAKINRKQD